MHVIFIPVTGAIETHHVRDEEFLDFLHDKCEGIVDVVRLRSPAIDVGEMSLYVNDTGLLTGMAPNMRAMSLAEKFGRLGQPLVGPAVLSGGVDRETGEDLALTDEQMALALGLVTA